MRLMMVDGYKISIWIKEPSLEYVIDYAPTSVSKIQRIERLYLSRFVSVSVFIN
jgi:hypothetical protein